MPIKDLNSSLQFPNTCLHCLHQSMTMMLGYWSKIKILQSIIRLDPIEMMNHVSLRDFTMSIHPDLNMFTNIAIGSHPGMIWRIKHYITSRVEIATTLPAWMITTSFQFCSTFNTMSRSLALRLATIRAYVISSIRLPSTFPTCFIMWMDKLIAKGTLLCTSIVIDIRYKFILASGTPLLMFLIGNIYLPASDAWFSMSSCSHCFSPIKGFINIITLFA